MTFKTQKEAREYLLSKGYKVSSGKFNQDKAKFTDSKGKIIFADLMDYARECCRPKTAEFDDYEHGRRIAELDLREKELKVAKLERAEDHVKKLEQQVADFAQQQAALVILIYDTIRHHINLAGREIAHASGVDMNRVPEMELQIEQVLDRAFNEIATSDNIIEMDIIDHAAEPDQYAAHN